MNPRVSIRFQTTLNHSASVCDEKIWRTMESERVSFKSHSSKLFKAITLIILEISFDKNWKLSKIWGVISLRHLERFVAFAICCLMAERTAIGPTFELVFKTDPKSLSEKKPLRAVVCFCRCFTHVFWVMSGAPTSLTSVKAF